MADIAKINGLDSASIDKFCGIDLSVIGSINGGIPFTITFPYTYDDFTGTNGDPADSSKWTQTNSLGSEFLSIQSNALNYDATGSTNDGTLLDTDGIATLSGDFDIQCSFAISDESGTHGGSSYFPILAVKTTDDDSEIGQVTVARNSTNSQYIARGTDITDTTITRSDSSGYLRITRISGVVTVYYWHNSQWEWDGNTSGITTETADTRDVYMVLYFEHENNGNVLVDVDDFTITSCDSLTLA